jgi:hypothetical protein
VGLPLSPLLEARALNRLRSPSAAERIWHV